jgi:hypothetical protein
LNLHVDFAAAVLVEHAPHSFHLGAHAIQEEDEEEEEAMSRWTLISEERLDSAREHATRSISHILVLENTYLPSRIGRVGAKRHLESPALLVLLHMFIKKSCTTPTVSFISWTVRRSLPSRNDLTKPRTTSACDSSPLPSSSKCANHARWETAQQQAAAR